MHLRLINPNTSARMTEQMAAEAVRVLHPDTRLSAVTPDKGPVSIESHFDEAIATIGVCDEILRGNADGVDGFILACFGDPGIWAARELSAAPVLGIAQAAFIMASMVSARFSVVTSLQRTVIQAEHLLKLYGYDAVCSGVSAVDLPVLALEDDVAFNAIVTHAENARDTQGAGAIVLGCGGMSHLRSAIEQKVGIPIVDGVTAAAKLLEAAVGLGLGTSKHGDLAFPIPKTYTGDLARFGDGG